MPSSVRSGHIWGGNAANLRHSVLSSNARQAIENRPWKWNGRSFCGREVQKKKRGACQGFCMSRENPRGSEMGPRRQGTATRLPHYETCGMRPRSIRLANISLTLTHPHPRSATCWQMSKKNAVDDFWLGGTRQIGPAARECARLLLSTTNIH